MTAQRNRRWKLVVLMGVLFILTVACSVEEMVCHLSGGIWEWNEHDVVDECVGAGDIYRAYYFFINKGPAVDSDEPVVSGPVIDSDGEDADPVPPAAPDPGGEAAQESVLQLEPPLEIDADEAPPADGAPPAPALDLESASPGEGDVSDLAGTYVGKTNFGSYYLDTYGGTVIVDELIITISENGMVEGTFTMKYDKGARGESCLTQTFITENGTLSGQIMQPTGTVSIEYTYDLEQVNISCKSGDYTSHHDGNISSLIKISGNTITGDGVGGIMFEATKQ